MAIAIHQLKSWNVSHQTQRIVMISSLDAWPSRLRLTYCCLPKQVACQQRLCWMVEDSRKRPNDLQISVAFEIENTWCLQGAHDVVVRQYTQRFNQRFAFRIVGQHPGSVQEDAQLTRIHGVDNHLRVRCDDQLSAAPCRGRPQ